MLQRLLQGHPTIYRYDKTWVGLLPALFLPFTAFPIFFFIRNSESWQQYWALATTPGILSPILSFGALLNLALFFLFLWRNYYNAARGVMLATILYAIPILWTKFG